MNFPINKMSSVILGSLLASALSGYLLAVYRYGSSDSSEEDYRRGLYDGSRSSCHEEKKYSSEVDRGLASGVMNLDYIYILEKNKLEERDRKIGAAFPKTDLGHAFTRLLTLLEYGTSIGFPAESKVFSEDLRWIESQPQESFILIQDAIKRLTVEYSTEQQFMIYLVGRLDINVQDKMDYLLNEVKKGYGGSEIKQSKANKMVALSTLMLLEVDPTTAEKAMKEFLSSNSSYGSKVLLLNLYETRFPDSGKKLRGDFGL